MVPGFNHNFTYRGTLFHVQTEDGGRKHPTIVSLLFSGGTVLASSKISYADILGSDLLEQAVEALMKEQHQDLLRRLKRGEFDETIAHVRSDVPATQSGEAATVVAAPSTSATGPDLQQLILAYLTGEAL